MGFHVDPTLCESLCPVSLYRSGRHLHIIGDLYISISLKSQIKTLRSEFVTIQRKNKKSQKRLDTDFDLIVENQTVVDAFQAIDINAFLSSDQGLFGLIWSPCEREKIKCDSVQYSAKKFDFKTCAIIKAMNDTGTGSNENRKHRHPGHNRKSTGADS